MQHKTSLVNHILHKCMPNSHRPIIILATFNGNTNTATVKSATANETMKKFCTIRNGLYVNTLNITKMFPIIVKSMIIVSITVTSIASHCGTAKSIPIIDGYRIDTGFGQLPIMLLFCSKKISSVAFSMAVMVVILVPGAVYRISLRLWTFSVLKLSLDLPLDDNLRIIADHCEMLT